MICKALEGGVLDPSTISVNLCGSSHQLGRTRPEMGGASASAIKRVFSRSALHPPGHAHRAKDQKKRLQCLCV